MSKATKESKESREDDGDEDEVKLDKTQGQAMKDMQSVSGYVPEETQDKLDNDKLEQVRTLVLVKKRWLGLVISLRIATRKTY
jgi:hypothetical protein